MICINGKIYYSLGRLVAEFPISVRGKPLNGKASGLPKRIRQENKLCFSERSMFENDVKIRALSHFILADSQRLTGLPLGRSSTLP